MRLHALVIVLAAGSLAAGCASQKKDIAAMTPPPATQAPVEQVAGTNDGAVTSTIVPGSQADLIAKAGSDRVLFEYDSFALSDEARAILVRQADWLRSNPQVVFTIEGHADERGTREYNLALGDRRANSVKNFLAAQGIATNRLRTISYGKERPEVQGSDEQSYAQNRRAVSVVASGAAS
jgi:peptidoglycan-associated lipoprotein